MSHFDGFVCCFMYRACMIVECSKIVKKNIFEYNLIVLEHERSKIKIFDSVICIM